ncbi:hypothetical protein CPB85DRAFT_1440556 [Mucidula mucida]|nr:hypothetical protein CPB85DRAFT_1440556 [Mucidula mucida]
MDSSDVYKKIRQSHLEELAELDLVKEPVPTPRMPRGSYNDLVQWTKDSQAQIQAGIANRVFGGNTNSPIDFNNVFMAFMESAAMYLRDESLVLKAVETFRAGDKNGALKLLERSTAAIDELAELWGMKFIVICDLLEQHPDGRHIIVGPYCGAHRIQGNWRPGVMDQRSLRGTDCSSFGGAPLWRTDLEGILLSIVFDVFRAAPYSRQKGYQIISSLASKTVITHVTVGTLAWCCLRVAVLRTAEDRGTGTEKADLGDLYTFGSPRVGRGDFASPSSSHDGGDLRLRVAHRQTKETTSPRSQRSAPWPISRDPFIHVDASYIFPERKPMPGPSEIGTHPMDAPTPWKPHEVDEYYKSLTFATTGRLPPDMRISDSRWLWAPRESVKLQDFAVASTQLFPGGPLVGEIVARGDATGIDADSVTLHCNSLKALCGVHTQCIMRATGDANPKEASIVFIADGVVVAVAVLAMKSEVKDICLDGTCAWEFADTPLVEKVSEEWQKATEVVFEKLFANV